MGDALHPVRLSGAGALTALGSSLDELFSGLLAGRSGLARPRRLELRGGAAPLGEIALSTPADAPRALLFAERAAREAAQAAGWSAAELGAEDTLLVLATTKGGLDVAELILEGRAPGSRAQESLLFDLAPRLAERLGIGGPRHTTSLACASGLTAVGLARAAVADGSARRALVVGADAATAFVYEGFTSLQALDPEGARPFDAARRGLSLGEGAAAVALERGTGGLELAGYGASNDANHITGPARDGRGLVRALELALAEARLPGRGPGLGLLHGTATPFNDQMEGIAYARVFGPRAFPVASVKGAVGHLLGAAGLVNLAVTARALEAGLCPPSVGLRELDPEIPLDVVGLAPRRVEAEAAVSSASGFGGVNAAVVLRRAPRGAGERPGTARRPAPRAPPLRASLAAAVDLAPERAALVERIGARAARRLDPLSLLAVGALDAGLAAAGLDAEALRGRRHALVLGTGLGCLEADLAFYEAARGRAQDPSPRLFAYTLPNIALGEAAIRLGLEGENVVVSAGRASALAALAAGAELVGRGTVEVAVVIAADASGPAAARLLGEAPLARAAAFVLEPRGEARLELGASTFPVPRGDLRRPARVEIEGRASSPPGPEPLGGAGLDALFDAVRRAAPLELVVRCPSGYGAALRLSPSGATQ